MNTPYDLGYFAYSISESYDNPYSRVDQPAEWDDYASGFMMAQTEAALGLCR
jgi:hypothetical protein